MKRMMGWRGKRPGRKEHGIWQGSWLNSGGTGLLLLPPVSLIAFFLYLNVFFLIDTLTALIKDGMLRLSCFPSKSVKGNDNSYLVEHTWAMHLSVFIFPPSANIFYCCFVIYLILQNLAYLPIESLCKTRSP